MAQTTVTQKGQIVIPKELRDKHGIRPNSRVIITEIDRHIAVLPCPQDPIKDGRGMLKLGRSVSDVVDEIRREERIREESLNSPGGKSERRRRQ